MVLMPSADLDAGFVLWHAGWTAAQKLQPAS